MEGGVRSRWALISEYDLEGILCPEVYGEGVLPCTVVLGARLQVYSVDAMFAMWLGHWGGGSPRFQSDHWN